MSTLRLRHAIAIAEEGDRILGRTLDESAPGNATTLLTVGTDGAAVRFTELPGPVEHRVAEYLARVLPTLCKHLGGHARRLDITIGAETLAARPGRTRRWIVGDIADASSSRAWEDWGAARRDLCLLVAYAILLHAVPL